MQTGIHPNVNQQFRYCYYHSFMSLADFVVWVERNEVLSRTSRAYRAADYKAPLNRHDPDGHRLREDPAGRLSEIQK
ncbi:hypothetical protein NicSoilB8_18520 [Arthrobacter sp. NicSoilB8]|nr:hypothetical protein NicSoilB8_18520 [Arthrobacter sp. NicSoilB8]